MAALEYDVVDVFTDRPFAGNQLAVVYGADGLTTSQLLAITREFNFSETTFPVALTEPDREAGADYRLKIFTLGGEIPFAGHPSLGTAWALHARDRLPAGARRQACGVGLIEMQVPVEPLAAVELSAAPRDLSSALSASSVAAVAGAVGLAATDVVGPVYAAGCGLSFVHLPVSRAAVTRARPGNLGVGELGLGDLGLGDPLEGINVFAIEEADAAVAGGPPDSEPRGPMQIRARVFVPGLSVVEDSATGSAAVGLGVALVAAGLAPGENETAYRIVQGVEMGRPSMLHGRVAAQAGRAVNCWVAGQVVAVATGSIAVPPS